jgi:hypothetical protein
MITLSVGFVTEYVRDSMTFSWAIEEGDVFLYDVSVKGNITTGTTTLPAHFLPLNNTRLSVEIISLPNVSITFYSGDFVEDIVEYVKTNTTFSNGTNIPTQFYFAINSYMSRCILPIGGWGHLDSLFPNDIERPVAPHESHLSARFSNYFYFGYSSNDTNQYIEWHGIIDTNNGIPQIVSFYNYWESPPWTYWYNVTMTLVT